MTPFASRERPTLAGLAREAAFPLAVIAAVTLVCLPLLLVGPQHGHSLAYNLAWSRGFTETLLAGDWYPRWLSRLNEGAGSPVFFFYGPIPFYFTAVGALLCPGCGVPVQLGIGEWLLVVASALAFYAFARGHARPLAAAAGALVYALMPYHLAVDLWVRQAMGEVGAYVWLPLALSAVDRIANGRPGIARLAMAYALLVMTHLPAALLFSPFLVAYGALRAWKDRSPATMARSLAGVALGCLIAGVYLFPALLLQDAISAHHFWVPYFRYDRWFVGSGESPEPRFSLQLLAVLVACTLAWAVPWVMAFRSSREADRLRAGAWLLFVAGAWLLMTPVSRPLWEALPVLQKVQFPWRVAIVLDFAVAATTVLAVKGIEVTGRRRAAMVCLAFAAFPVLASVVLTARWSHWELSRSATRRAEIARLVDSSVHADEYFTPLARVSPAEVRAAVAAAPGLLHEASGRGHMTVLWRTPRRIGLRVSFESPADVEVRQLYFPGWIARIEGRSEPIRATASSPYGLIVFSLPAGSYDLEILLARTRQETAGLVTSGLAMLILIAIVWLDRRRPDRP